MNVEFPGVDIVPLLNTLLMAASLLSLAWLVALGVIQKPGRFRLAGRIILAPALPPEQGVATIGGPSRPPRMSMLTRAPPVYPHHLRYGYRGHPTVQ